MNSNTILFVTAFKDINRKDWSDLSKSNELYFQEYKNLIENLDYGLITYAEGEIYEKIRDISKPYPNVTVINTKEFPHNENLITFYDKNLESERTIMASEIYKKKVSEDRQKQPEHCHPEYTLINHSKVNYVAYTKKLYPTYEYYSWLDFGCIRRTIYDVPKNIDFRKLALTKPSIYYLSLEKLPQKKVSADTMLLSHSIYIAGSQFIVHTELVETFETLYDSKLEEWKKNIVADDDQNLVLQLYFGHPNLFTLFSNYSEYHLYMWFTLFRKFLNQSITQDKSQKPSLYPLTKQDIPNLINTYGFTGNYIEVGVSRGHFSDFIIKNTKLGTEKNTKIFLIDPYRNFEQVIYNDGDNYQNMDELYNFTKKRFERENRVELIRKTGDEVVEQFKDESIDIVYIDGNHAYEFVMNDLKNYWPKVKKGGFLLGDDVYDFRVGDIQLNDKDFIRIWDGKPLCQSVSFGCYGVKEAMIDFCKEMNLKYIRFDTQFMIYKF